MSRLDILRRGLGEWFLRKERARQLESMRAIMADGMPRAPTTGGRIDIVTLAGRPYAVNSDLPEPVRITSLEEAREVFGEGSLISDAIRRHSTADNPSGEELRHIEEAREHVREAWGVGCERCDDDDWEPPGEVEGLPRWVEDQIPEPCPECGLSQLGALTIRRTDPPVAGVELDPHGRVMHVRFPPMRIVRFQVKFKYPGTRLARTFDEHAGKWPAQRSPTNERSNPHTSTKTPHPPADRSAQRATASPCSREGNGGEEGGSPEGEGRP